MNPSPLLGYIMDLNRASLIGHVGQDIAIKQSKNNKQFATFSLATSESWKDKQSGELKSESQWHRVTIFNDKLIEVAKKHAKKGARLFIEGTIKYRKYKDKDGIEKTTTDIEIGQYGGSLISFPKIKDTSNSQSDESESLHDDEIPF